MGIPSYFSYIVKNYSNIIKSISYFYDVNNKIDHLYMDCNSIIYDAVHNIKNDNIDDYEHIIIKYVIDKLLDYINIIKPDKTVYITFDGVAPFAKMNQQRTRRYKNLFINKINETETTWNTSNITPGTKFMNRLTNMINTQIKVWNREMNINILFSGTDEKGEGEHKLFHELRNSNFTNDNVAVYGLDSDLLMLSIFHLQYCKNIYVFRETPEFCKTTIPRSLINRDDIFCFMDIQSFVETIQENMGCCYSHIRRTYDYIFVCFFLGNDFLPHFPSLNIRTHGIQVLLDIYKLHIGNYEDRYLITDNYQLNWKYIKLFIKELAKTEHELLLQEYKLRHKFENYKNKDDKELFHNLPIMHRSVEKYICPSESKWEERYYTSIFHQKRNEQNIKEISNNYLQGLEWVFKYYTHGCLDWKWSYKYHYPPLLVDLYKYVSDFNMEYFQEVNVESYNSMVQLAYVLPKDNLSLLPEPVYKYLLTNYSHLYPEQYDFMMAYCRYFWETHPVLPNISNEVMDKWERTFK